VLLITGIIVLLVLYPPVIYHLSVGIGPAFILLSGLFSVIGALAFVIGFVGYCGAQRESKLLLIIVRVHIMWYIDV